MPLRQRLAGLLQGRQDVRLIGYACFGQCELGPNVAFLPQEEWFGGLSDAGAAERVAAYPGGGAEPGERLTLPEAEKREHLRNMAELIGTIERDSRPGKRWWWPF
jgi:(2Fe-2S) ferredoxin